MIRFTIIFLTTAYLMMLSSVRLPAQDPFDLDEVKVVAPYEPSISDAFMITLNPRIEDTLDITLDFAYSIQPRKIATSFELEPISPARMRGEPLTKLYRGLVKGGLGNYSTPYFEGFYNTLRSNNGSLGIHLKHHSSGGGIPDVAHNAFSNNFAAVQGQKFFRNNSLGGDLNYDRQVVHYYGFQRDDYAEDPVMLNFIDSLSNDDLRQQFDLLSANISFGTNQADSSRFRHTNGFGYRWLKDRFETTEHHILYNGHIGQNIAADPFGMADKQYFSLDVAGEFLNSTNRLDTSNTWLIGAQPRLWSRYNIFQFYIGVNAVFQIDTISYFRAYPLLGVQLDIMKNRLVAFLQLSGNTEKHSLQSLRQINPFVKSGSSFAFMNIKSDIGGGLKGALGDIIGYSLSLNRAVIENHPFFVNDTASVLNNTFAVVYDDVSRFNLRANISAQFGERFSAMVTANHYQYGLSNESEAWHTPANTISAHVKYNIQDKIIFTSDVFARSETYGRVFNGQGDPTAVIAHPFHVDVNFGVEYRYTKKLSVFLNFANVGNNALERWLNYPSQGFNFLGGAAFSF